jgi:hypothetical protein
MDHPTRPTQIDPHEKTPPDQYDRRAWTIVTGNQGRTYVMASGALAPTQISDSNELLILITVDIKDH